MLYVTVRIPYSRSNASEAVKPKKLDISKQNFLERAKQEEAEKIAEERRRRNEEDRKLREKSVQIISFIKATETVR